MVFNSIFIGIYNFFYGTRTSRKNIKTKTSSMRTKYFILLGFISFFLFFFTYSNAQFSSFLLVSNVQISIETSDLSIGSKVNALAKSSSVDLEGSTITWTHNGVKVLSGRGETSYTLTLG